MGNKKAIPLQLSLLKPLLVTALLLAASLLPAQNLSGITGKKDTSYTTYSAFIKDKKHHPHIQLPVVPANDQVKQKLGIIYRSLGKRKLLLDAFHPVKAKSNGVAIIIIHGGGWRSGSRTQHYDMAKVLAAKGYTCFTPQYRLSSEALFPAAVHDVKAAIQWVRLHATAYGIDTAKIALAGFSAGGQLAALAGTTGNMPVFQNEEINKGVSTEVSAIIDIDGTLSFVHEESSERQSPDKWVASALWLGYLPRENPVLWQLASPLNFAAYSPPVLFINSSVKRMHAGRNDFIKILNERGVYHQLKTFADAPHSFCLFEPWFTPTIEVMDEFLKKIFVKN